MAQKKSWFKSLISWLTVLENPSTIINEITPYETYLTEEINKDSELENPSTIINEFTPYETYLTEENTILNELEQSEKYLIEEINKDSVLENPSTIINELKQSEEYLTEGNIKDSPLEKCEKINEESLKLNLCIKCNNKKVYYPLNDPLIINNSDFIECVNEGTKPSNFYFNFVAQTYDKCYESCSSCIYGGNENENNCSICAINYIFEPYKIGSKNCVKKCPYFYYLSSDNEYKCTNKSQCLGEKFLFIKKKLECIDNCDKDDIYMYQYNGECISKCPENTQSNQNKICLYRDISICSFYENELFLIENITEKEVEQMISNYASEFQYTYNHILLLKNNIYSIIIYKNTSCIFEKSFENINLEIFGECGKNLIYNFTKNETSLKVILIEKENDLYYMKINSYTEHNLIPSNNFRDEFLKCKKEICNSINFFNNLCSQINKEKYDMSKIIREDYKNRILDSIIFNQILKEKKNLIGVHKNKIYEITSSYNQNNNDYYNISVINFGECEKKLRSENNISENSSLLIFKMDILEEGFLIPIIEYEVYNSETRKILDLNVCKNIKINISNFPNINENNLFKYNQSSEYYNDICFPYTTKYKTDIILKDRRNEFLDNNLSLCEKDCEYIGYNVNKKKAECKCFVKLKFPLLSEIKINKDKLLNNFKDLEKSSNINVIKCYKLLFKKGGLKYNFGNYFLLSIIFINIILIIIFKVKGYKNIMHITFKVTKNKRKEDINNNKYKNETKNRINNDGENKSKNKFKNDIKNNKIFEKNNYSKKDSKKKHKIGNRKMKKETITDNSYSKLKNRNNKINEPNEKKQIKKIKKTDLLKYNDYELNNLLYNDAKFIDKRTYFQYYFSLLRTKHLMIFTFYTNTDYNSRTIKIALFLFSFSQFYIINALFFNDPTFHKIYEEKGSCNFIYQLPSILYSSIISCTIDLFINYFSLSEKNIIKIKNSKTKNNAMKEVNFLKIKFILFFIFDFLFLLLFWFYISCFCAVYKNTQIHHIKDTLISFGLSQVYPFMINLIPGFIRIPSLKSEKNKKYAYKISLAAQLI